MLQIDIITKALPSLEIVNLFCQKLFNWIPLSTGFWSSQQMRVKHFPPNRDWQVSLSLSLSLSCVLFQSLFLYSMIDSWLDPIVYIFDSHFDQWLSLFVFILVVDLSKYQLYQSIWPSVYLFVILLTATLSITKLYFKLF